MMDVSIDNLKKLMAELKDRSSNHNEPTKGKGTRLNLIICNGHKTSKKHFNLNNSSLNFPGPKRPWQ